MDKNEFNQLDAQSGESRFAQMSALEHQEAQSWLDDWNTKLDAALEVLSCGICTREHREHECPIPSEV